MRATLALLVTCLALSTLCGCSGGPEIASVEGTVTMDGKPLPNALVMFYNNQGRPAGARTDSSGHYVLNFTEGRQGAPPGIAKVRISTAQEVGEDDDGNPTPAVKETVPMRYNAATELEFDVKAGTKNIADFQLTSEGKVLSATSSY